jgi:hypothetical protein
MPGTTYEFRVVGKDTSGNTAETGTSTVISGTCQADAYESADGQYTGSTPLVMGQPQEHNFCANDTDWATFNAEAGKAYFINAESISGGAAFKLELYDASGTTLVASTFSTGLGQSAGLFLKPAASGKYYLKVTPVVPELAGTDVRYRLSMGDAIVYYFPLVGR